MGVKNVNITVDVNKPDKYYRTLQNITVKRGVTLDWCHNDFSFENAKIIFEGQYTFGRNIVYKIDKLINPTSLTSNTDRIDQYCICFDEKLMNLFVIGHKCSVYDNVKKAEVEIPIKNIKKAIAIANNPVCYKLKSHILELKKGVKLSDILDMNGLKNLDMFSINNGNVALRFVKVGSTKDTRYSFDRTHSNLSSPQDRYITTEDRWRVILIKV